MDIFLDMTGTITDMQTEDHALLKLGEAIKERFKISMSAEDIVKRINEYRKPFMDKRDEEYTPIRFLVSGGVEHILGRKLRYDEKEWVEKKYVEIHGLYVKLAPGAGEALEEMRNIAEHMGIITDGDRPYTDNLLRSLKIREFFDSVTTAEDVGVGKPNPKIFQQGISLSSSEPKIYIGDSEKRDMKGAKSVGMIAIKIGGRTKYGDYHARNLREAVKVIQALLRP